MSRKQDKVDVVQNAKAIAYAIIGFSLGLTLILYLTWSVIKLLIRF